MRWRTGFRDAEVGTDVFVCDVSSENLALATDLLAETPYRGRLALTQHDRAGRIDVLVNTAAFVRWRNFEEMTADECDRTMRTGDDVTVNAVRAVLR